VRRDRHDAYHQGIPVEEVREKRQRAREEHDKRLRESLPREWLDKYDLLTDQGRKDFLASRKEAGLKIDPATAEVIMTWAGMMDPYGIWGDDIEDNIDRAWFACAPGSDIWVEFHDLPEETRKALEGKPVANADELKALFETLENCEAVVEGDTVTFLNTEEELRDDYERRLREKGIKPLKDPPF